MTMNNIAIRLESITREVVRLEAARDKWEQEAEEYRVQAVELMGEFPRDAYIDQLKEALLFYAAPASYTAQNPGLGSPVWRDVGERARKALGVTAQTFVDDLNAREENGASTILDPSRPCVHCGGPMDLEIENCSHHAEHGMGL